MRQLILIALLAPATLLAYQPAPLLSVEFGAPVFGGTGCPGGGALTVLDQTKMIYEIDFEGFTVQTGGESRRPFDRKICNVAVPATLSPGASIAVSKIRYHGANELGTGGVAKVSTEAFFAGTRSPMIQRVFNESGEFNIELTLSEVEKSWSGCGVATNLRLNISDELRSAYFEEVSSSKIASKLTFQLESRRCQ